MIRLSIFKFDLLDCECVDIIIEKRHEYIYYVLDIVGTDADVASGDVFTLLLSNDFDVGFNDRLCCPVHFAFLCDWCSRFFFCFCFFLDRNKPLGGSGKRLAIMNATHSSIVPPGCSNRHSSAYASQILVGKSSVCLIPESQCDRIYIYIIYIYIYV